MELADVFADVATDIAADVVADVATKVVVAAEAVAEVAGRTELEARVEIWQLKELKVFDSLRLSMVLLMAVRY